VKIYLMMLMSDILDDRMSASYKEIDYRIRAAKHVERAIFADSFKNIPFQPVADYQYVGMGSVFFVDFRLFHKALGIKQMISIERGDGGDRDRFVYNQPFSCLTLKFGETTTILPELDFAGPTIAWMDYDSELQADILSDVRLLSNKMQSGSFLGVTVNCSSLKNRAKNTSGGKTARDLLVALVGEEKVPAGIKAGDLDPKGTATTYYQIMVNDINNILLSRNTSLPEDAQLKFQQVFFLRYADGAEMMTLGGFFLNQKDQAIFSGSNYKNQAYYSETDQYITIEVPKLTMKEILVLEQYAPDNNIESLEELVPDDFPFLQIPQVQIERYLKSYRYLPNYVSAEIN
jgi:hypothetical protein